MGGSALEPFDCHDKDDFAQEPSSARFEGFGIGPDGCQYVLDIYIYILFVLCKIIVVKIRDLNHSSQQSIFSFCSYFLDLSDDGHV